MTTSPTGFTDDGPGRVDRHLQDGQPRAPAPAVTIEKSTNGSRRRRPAGAVRPGRRRGPVDLRRDQYRQRHAAEIAVRDDRGRAANCPATSSRPARHDLPAGTRDRRRPVHEHRLGDRGRPVRDGVNDTDPSHYFRHRARDRHREGDQRRRRRPAAGTVSSRSAAQWCGRTSSPTSATPPLTGIEVTDDQRRPGPRCPSATLVPSASMNCTAPTGYRASPGQYENTATVTDGDARRRRPGLRCLALLRRDPSIDAREVRQRRGRRRRRRAAGDRRRPGRLAIRDDQHRQRPALLVPDRLRGSRVDRLPALGDRARASPSCAGPSGPSGGPVRLNTGRSLAPDLPGRVPRDASD